MSLSDLASLGSFVSGIAVVVTLIFLVIQTRQNTKAVRAAASQAHAANMQDILSPMILDADTARVFRTGFDHVESLGEDDRVRFFLILSGVFRWYQASRLQWKHGQLDAEHWYQVEAQARDIIRYPGVQTYWKLRRHWHSQEFCDWLDALPKVKAPRGLYELPSEDNKASAAPP